jgi:RNA polymerase sigma factor FliA
VTSASQAAPLLAAFLASRSDADRAALIEAHRPLVETTARGFLRRLPPHLELEELVSAGHLGLIRAVDRFDPARGTAFGTWAITCIRGAIRHELEDVRGPAVEFLPLEAAECQADAGPDPFALALAGEQKRLLTAAIARLPERWRQVVEGRFYGGRDYRGLGAELGISGSRVKQIEQKAVLALQRILTLDAPVFVDEAELPTPGPLCSPALEPEKEFADA